MSRVLSERRQIDDRKDFETLVVLVAAFLVFLSAGASDHICQRSGVLFDFLAGSRDALRAAVVLLSTNGDCIVSMMSNTNG